MRQEDKDDRGSWVTGKGKAAALKRECGSSDRETGEGRRKQQKKKILLKYTIQKISHKTDHHP